MIYECINTNIIALNTSPSAISSYTISTLQDVLQCKLDDSLCIYCCYFETFLKSFLQSVFCDTSSGLLSHKSIENRANKQRNDDSVLRTLRRERLFVRR